MLKKTFLVLSLAVSACSFGPGNIQFRHSTDLEARRIRRIAVVPPQSGGAAAPKVPFGAAPEQKSSERDAPENLARFIYAALVALPQWQIISESEVQEVSGSVGPASDAARLKQIGEMVYADAVMVGRVLRYREREGAEWGVKSPASVAFILDLVDVRRGDVIWSSRFDETQQAPSENIFALGDIGQRGIRWLTADQLAQDGVRKAVAQLHQILARPPS
jgi:TolB-like protein